MKAAPLRWTLARQSRITATEKVLAGLGDAAAEGPLIGVWGRGAVRVRADIVFADPTP